MHALEPSKRIHQLGFSYNSSARPTELAITRHITSYTYAISDYRALKHTLGALSFGFFSFRNRHFNPDRSAKSERTNNNHCYSGHHHGVSTNCINTRYGYSVSVFFFFFPPFSTARSLSHTVAKRDFRTNLRSFNLFCFFPLPSLSFAKAFSTLPSRRNQ